MAAIVIALGAGLAACGGGDKDGKDAEKGATPAAIAASGVVIPQPIKDPGFPVDSATILGWVSTTDTTDIRKHAWEIWAGLTANSGQSWNGAELPVYETWLSRYEVYNAGAVADKRLLATRGRALDRGFHSPVQFHHPGSLTGSRAQGTGGSPPRERLVAGVKYDMAAAEHVWANLYTDSARLTALNDTFNTNSTPIAERNIQPFPARAIAVKPVYQLVSATGITVLPYWVSPSASTDPSQPTPSTWTQFVAVDPSGQKVGQTITVQWGGKSYQAKVIALSEFYSFKLTQNEVDDIITSDTTTQSTPLDVEVSNDSMSVINGGTQAEQLVKAGDYGVLVAMHVSTKEIGNWTWQTFWFTPDAANNPLSKDQTAGVTGPFKNFAMQQAYYMTVPSGPQQRQNQVAFNPYLETAFADSGTVSNCMSCHRMASWPTNNYHFYGNIDPASPTLFTGVAKLDFLWSIQAGASTAEASLLRRIRAQSRATPAAAAGAPPATGSGNGR
jgi:hypothetical protein